MLTFSDIGNAKIEGLEDSLGMTDTDYNVSSLANLIYQNIANHFRQIAGGRGHFLCSICTVSVHQNAIVLEEKLLISLQMRSAL